MCRVSTRPRNCLNNCGCTPCADQRSWLEGVPIVIQARQGQYAEAEHTAKRWREQAALGDLLEMGRLLVCAAIWEEQSDLAQRRWGKLAAEILDAALRTPAGLSAAEQAEARLLQAEARYLVGDRLRARQELERIPEQPADQDDPTLSLRRDRTPPRRLRGGLAHRPGAVAPAARRHARLARRAVQPGLDLSQGRPGAGRPADPGRDRVAPSQPGWDGRPRSSNGCGNGCASYAERVKCPDSRCQIPDSRFQIPDGG